MVSSSPKDVGASRSLGPECRLRRRSDIDRCQKEGEKLYSKHFLILTIPSEGPESRLAVTVTTKIDKRAVARNKIKRRVREVFRSVRSQFVRPTDIVVVARRGVQECEFDDYKREILGALRSGGLFVKTR